MGNRGRGQGTHVAQAREILPLGRGGETIRLSRIAAGMVLWFALAGLVFLETGVNAKDFSLWMIIALVAPPTFAISAFLGDRSSRGFSTTRTRQRRDGAPISRADRSPPRD